MKDNAYKTVSHDDTFAFGRALGEKLCPGDIVLLKGDLGTGKSVLARGIADAMGITGPMPSPTFTLMIPYEGEKKLYHFDLYRISGPDEFFAAGLDEPLYGDGVCVIEWPEMAELDEARAIKISLSRTDDPNVREISVFSPRRPQISAALAAWEVGA